MNRRSILLSVFCVGLLLSGCGGTPSSPTPPGNPPPQPTLKDTKPPQLLSQSPEPGEEEIAPDTSVQIVFDEPIDFTGLAEHIRLTASNGEIAHIEVDCESPCIQITVTPQTPLRYDMRYTVTVDPIGNLSGNLLPAPIRWSFTTQSTAPTSDTTPPRLLSITPSNGATGVDEGTLVTFTFDEGIDPNRMNSTTFKLVPDGESVPILGTYGCDPSCTVVTFAPAVQLRLNAIYRVEATTEIADPSGNRLTAPYLGRFVTRPRPLPPPSPWSKGMGNRFNQHLYRADAISADRAWAVGERGLIVATSDAGASWHLQESGTSLPLYGIDFIDAQTGFASEVIRRDRIHLPMPF